MNAATDRDYIDGKLVTIEARMDARIASIEASIRGFLDNVFRHNHACAAIPAAMMARSQYGGSPKCSLRKRINSWAFA